MGPTTKDREKEEFQESSQAILRRLDKETTKKERLQKQLNDVYRYVKHLMKPLQVVGSERMTPEGMFPKEAFTELEKIKASTHATHEWLQGVEH